MTVDRVEQEAKWEDGTGEERVRSDPVTLNEARCAAKCVSYRPWCRRGLYLLLLRL